MHDQKEIKLGAEYKSSVTFFFMFHLMIHQCDYEKLQRELIWRMTLLIGEGRAAVCMGFFF